MGFLAVQQIGRYRILGELGRGAMGIVYRAQDPTIGRVIAIKSIRLQEMSDETERARLRERLFREAQSAGVLSHPHIVTIYDILEENNLAYIFMECVNGPPLDDWLRSNHPPAPGQLIRILGQVGEALDYAHKRGIIHRDIKPANIMVHEEVAAKVCDFGIAKIASQQLTQTGLLMGTPSYMSPEQLQGEKVDGRSDQFALAVMVYEFLAGQKPFSGDSIPALIFRICRDDPPDIEEMNPTVGPLVNTVVRKALAKRPDDRYDSCAKFIAFVAKALEGRDWVVPATARAGREDSTTASGDTSGVLTSSALDEDEDRTTMSGLRPVTSEEPAADDTPASAETPAAPAGPVPSPAFAANPFRPELGGVAARASESGGIPRTTGVELPVRRLDEAPATSSKGRGMLMIPLVLALAGAGYFGWTKMGGVGAGASDAPPVVAPEPAKPEPAVSGGGPAVTNPPVEVPKPVPPPVVVVENPKPGGTVPENPTPPVVNTEPPKPNVPVGSTAVMFTTSPPGASVVVDNSTETSCKSPCTLSLDKGRHTVMTALEGYVPASRIFHVPDLTAITVTLEIDGGKVRILTNPPGASISINGQPHHSVSPAVLTLRTGSYLIELAKDGRKHSETVTVKRDSVSTVSIDWQ